MSRAIIAGVTEVTAVASARGFRVEAKPIDMGGGAFLRIRKERDWGTVHVNRAGELVGWRTGSCPALEQLKAVRG